MIESEWPVPQEPMSLGEVYRSAFRLVRRTAARGLTLALVLLVPLYVVLADVARTFFLKTAAAFGSQSGSPADVAEESIAAMYAQVAGDATPLVLLSLVLLVVSTLVQLANTVEAWDHALLIDRSISEWFARIFGRPFVTAFAQLVVMLMFIGAIFGMAMLFAAIFAGAAGPAGISLAMGAATGLLLYLALKVAFRLHEIVADDRGPWRSLVSSAALVRGSWFKVFATLFPVVVALVVLSEIAQRLLGGSIDTAAIQGTDESFEGLAAGYRALAAAFTTQQAIALGVISAVAQYFIVNVLTPLYVDLRARRGDFEE